MTCHVGGTIRGVEPKHEHMGEWTRYAMVQIFRS